jgi:DNA-binding transcriptional ArsR family regulator
VKQTTTSTGIDQRLVKAIGHPLRQRLLAILNERVASPNELAKETGAPLGNVSYHVRLLADLECVELVKTEPRRGAVEHYYQATIAPWFDKESWGNLPASVRSGASSTSLSIIVDEAAAAMRAGTFDSRADNHVSRSTLMLDEEGWKELAGLLDDLLERALQLKAESANRAVESNTEGDLIPCTMVLMHFPTARGS